MSQITTIKLSKKTVELLNKLKVHPRQAYEEVVLKLLKKARFDKNKKGNYGIGNLIFPLFLGILVIFGLFYIEGAITGQVVFSEENNYTQILNLEANNETEYLWVLENPGGLKSIKLSGFYEENTSARVYIENNNVKHLILDTNALNTAQSISPITGFAVNKGLGIALNKTANLTLPFNKTLPLNKTLNETIKKITINKSITINLQYDENALYDENNDGIETLTGVVDLTVENTNFNWDANEENLCTRWETYSVEDEESTIVCYGSNRCCQFVDLLATRPLWNEPFYSAYGQYGATYNNIVSAQILSVDYNLNLADPYSEIYFSEWADLNANYHVSTTSFEDICVETCILDNFDDNEYKLIFEVDNGVLRIDTVEYTTKVVIEENVTPIEIVNITPELNITPKIVTKKKDFKFDEDIELDFEYLFKEELVEQGRWKEEYEFYEEETDKTDAELEILSKKLIKKEKQNKKWETTSETIETFVFDYKDDLVDIDVEIEELREGKFKITLPKKRAFRAGKYTIKLELIKDGITYTQEQNFTWGVLAINVNKSIYLENQDSFIGIAVLDDQGRMVCDADVTLEITNPLNQKTTLTTAAGDIAISPECEVYGVTNLPDYYTKYSVSGIGTYVMNLTAITFNGIRSIQDDFSVQGTVDFDVARDGPTRIFPPVPYTMEFTINANKNYNGVINEYVPASFDIAPQPGLTLTTVGDTKVLSWNKNLVAGETYKINYEFDAPDISPEFYLLGALEIGSFKEIRQWQIASDAIVVKFFDEFNDPSPPALFNWTRSGATPAWGNFDGASAEAGNENFETCDSGGSNISFTNSIDLSDCTAGTIFANWSQVEIGNLDDPDCLNLTTSTDGGATYATLTGVFCNDNPPTSAGHEISGTPSDFRFRFTCFGLSATGGVGEIIKITQFNITCDVVGPIVDNTPPIINGTLNETTIITGTVLNATFNATDNVNLTNGTIVINSTGADDIRYYNFSFVDDGVNPTNTQQISQNFTISEAVGTVINITGIARDNSSNQAQNETIFTVVTPPDTTPPVVNTSLNKSFTTIRRNDVINITANATDVDGGLDTCQFFFNGTPGGSFIILNETFPTSTIEGQCSQNWTIELVRGNVINFSVVVNDTSTDVPAGGNTALNDTIITVAESVASVSIGINNSAPKINEVVNVSSNATDLDDLAFCLIKHNGTADGSFTNSTFELSGTDGFCSDPISITLVRGNVVNFTIEINDSVGGIIYENSTNVTVANTPAPNATIVFPINDFKTNLQPLDLNITYIGDPDLDVINITYYIDGKINTTQLQFNTTFNATDGTYILNVSLHDNVTPLEYSANVTINFTIDTVIPVVNASLNESLTNIGLGDVINLSANATDEFELSFGQIIINASPAGSELIRYFNFSFSGKEDDGNFSQNITIDCNGGCVINFTARVNDSAGNFRTNDTIITVVDKVNPIVNTTLNKSLTSIFQNDVINLSANITDNIALSFCQIIINQSGPSALEIINISLSGTTGQCYNVSKVTLPTGGVINYTIRANDTSNNFRTNDTIITVVSGDTQAPVINGTINNTSPKFGEIINATYNITDVGGTLSTGNISINTSGPPAQNFSFVLSGTEIQMSQNITVNLTRGNVLNITGFAVDTADNIKQNSTLITVANTPAPQASFVFPTNDFKTNLNNFDLNITYIADPDLDVINITYYIDGKINTTQLQFNTTFNASDGTYILNVSLHDNVTPLEYSANVTINFTIDTVTPVVNASLNESLTNIAFGDFINLSANATDEFELSFGQIIINASPAGSELIRYFNFSFSGKEDDGNFSQNITIDCFGGCVINFTARVNDSAGNFRTNDTIITVVDDINPIVNGSLNKSLTSISQNDVINASYNATDEVALEFGQIIINASPSGQELIRYFNFSFSGKEDDGNFSQNFTVDCAAGCVINITARVNDTSGNFKNNETIITVVDDVAPIINSSFNMSFGDIRINDVLNVSFNLTDETELLNANITHNMTNDLISYVFNITFGGGVTDTIISNTTKITVRRGSVINFTGYATDTSNNVKQNSTLIVVNNTPAPNATIVFPTNDFKTNLQPLDLNITYIADPDLDVINITYYIDGKINTTQLQFNTTFNASDGTYILNVSLHDNVTPLEYSANVTINFTIDTTVPVVNASLNESLTNIGFGDVINLSANATDEFELSFGQIIINASPAGSELIRYFNFSFSGKEDDGNLSQNITIDCLGGCVINFTARVNDSAGNYWTNDTIITVVDDIKPRINASIFNVSAPRKGDVVNFTANVTDEVALSFCQLTMNGTSDGSFVILNKSVTGTDDQCSQNFTIDLVRGNVINFTVLVNDTSNNLNQSEQIVTVSDFKATVSIGINNSVPKINEVVNVSSNATDLDDLSFCLIKHNGTATGDFTNSTFELSGTDGFCSDPISITLVRGNVVNFTIEINDSVGGIIYENSTNVTVANTPAPQANIIFPINDSKINLNNFDLNITYIGDPDLDVINITYYIDGKINTTQLQFNTTFNASDGTYILNVSLHDNVTPLEYSANVTINFTIDTVTPVVNASLNESLTNIGFGDVINLSANATDEFELSFGQIIINASPSGQELIRYFNFSFSGKEDDGNFSQNITIDCNGGCVINFTARVNDSAGNFRTNDTIITVVDKVNPIVNTTLNKSLTSIFQNDIINFSANITDEVGLSFCQIIINQSGPDNLEIINISLSGTTGQCYNVSEVTLPTGGVINYTIRVNDTSNNFRTNDTIITVAPPSTGDSTPPVINGTLNNTSPQQGFVVNATFNATDETNLTNGTVIINDTGFKRFFNFSLNGSANITLQFSQNFTVSCGEGCVIGVTGVARDNSSNEAENETIITVPDITKPRINASIFNVSAPRKGDVVNFTANVTNIALDTCQFFMNGTSDGSFVILNKSVTGTDDQCSQNFTIDLVRGNVINFTALVNDTSNNLNQSEQIITVANTPAPQANITFPINDSKINLNNFDLNITYIADPDLDVINITYYIDGKINTTQLQFNTTFNATDGTYILNVSLHDNVTPLEYSANVTINFTIDTVLPVVNATLNISLTNIRTNDIVNITTNTTDDVDLSTGQVIVNISGFKKYFNFSLSGTTATFSQNITINVTRGNVINFTARVNDTATNFRTNDTIITVSDSVANVSIGINNSAPKINEVINVSSNATDLDDLAFCLIKHNGTADGSFTNSTFELSGTDGFCSDPISITLVRGNVVNFTIEINDSVGGIIYENSTKVTVANTPPPAAEIVFPSDDQKFNSIPIELNVTFAADADNDAITINYYIDGKINSSTNVNTTFNASNGVFILNVSLDDGQDSSANVTINFTLDITVPVVNTSLNKSLTTIAFGDVINITANATDETALANATIIVNDTGFNRFFNFSVESLTEAEFSQNITVNCTRRCVINFTARVNDTAGNFRTNDTIIEVANTPPSGLSIVFPTNDLYTNKQPLDLNVTFTEDVDQDTITINYYIDGKLNDSTTTNTTFNASDKTYILNVSITDGTNHSTNATINFTLDTVAPNVTLISPANDTVNTDGNISFSYNVTDTFQIGNCSLILNNKINLTNSSIINGTRQYFNLSNLPVLQYNWSVNCSDSTNNIGSSKERSVSVILFKNFNGSTTNFTNVSIRNITNLVLEVKPFGKINFSQNVDLSGGADINRYINISFNRIEINSTAINALNKSADLILRDLTFTDPRILRDGSLCPSSICTKLNFTGGNLTFNVTHFTIYSAEETPDEDEGDTGSGGGGGGGGRSTSGAGGLIVVRKDFSLDKNVIKESLLQGATKTAELKIGNRGDTKLEFSVEIENLEKFVVVSQDSFELEPGETKTITFSFTASETEIPGVYSGKIVIKADGIEKNVITIVEVVSRKALFDVSITVDENYKKVLRAQEVKFDIDIVNLGTLKPVDVELYYAIKDLNENVVTFRTESLGINDKLSVKRSLKIPEDIELGNYIVYGRLLFKDQIAASSDLFEIVEILPIIKPRINIGLIVALILVLIISSILITSIVTHYMYDVREKQREKIQRNVQELLEKKRKERFTVLQKQVTPQRDLNPLIKHYKRCMENNLEFLSDNEIIEKGWKLDEIIAAKKKASEIVFKAKQMVKLKKITPEFKQMEKGATQVATKKTQWPIPTAKKEVIPRKRISLKKTIPTQSPVLSEVKKEAKLPMVASKEKKEIVKVDETLPIMNSKVEPISPEIARKREFKLMDKGLLEAVLKKIPPDIEEKLFEDIITLNYRGHKKNEIKNILINKGFNLDEIDHAIKIFSENEFEIMDKGLLKSVMENTPHSLNKKVYREIVALSDLGYEKDSIKNILMGKDYDLVEIDYAIETFIKRKNFQNK